MNSPLFLSEVSFVSVNLCSGTLVFTPVKQSATSEMLGIPAMSTMPIDASNAHPRAEISDFDTVVRHYWPRVFRFIFASLREHDAAETLTQDCFLRAYQARQQFRGDASLNSWLMKIAINLVRDHTRNRRLKFWKSLKDTSVDCSLLNEGMEGHDASPERQAVVRQQMEAVWRATGELSEQQRTAFLLRFVEDMELLEIARVMGVSEG